MKPKDKQYVFTTLQALQALLQSRTAMESLSNRRSASPTGIFLEEFDAQALDVRLAACLDLLVKLPTPGMEGDG